MQPNAESVVVLDFETTGLSPDQGDRAIEIGAVRLQNGVITERFQQLMDPGRRISPFIEEYTGITNAMLADAAPVSQVMAEFADFIGDDNLVAHNASFDKRFLDAEFARISRSYPGEFACSLLVSRRLYQDCPNHKLGTLVRWKNITGEGSFHRALYDAEMTAYLWLAMLADIREQSQLELVPFELVTELSKTAKKSVGAFFSRW
ncbi:3'-5' exonuclease [Thalassomonas viridans]|uniref:DNA-directed DNA polymerase n=1 Tax=Thalassomonas viridans TaxID=137584 RepID=A0AAE9Z0F1_9GAMM|nr:3'-5' exonuclease [Thalassomonas viridans]WDE03739.1 3'-5' exonuclease [Thalassomonas viridans]